MENLDKYTFPTKYGKLLSTQPFPNGNMLRATAEFLYLTEGSDYFIEAELKGGISDCEISSGVFSRYPDSVENTQVDDYLVLGNDWLIARRILSAARKNRGCVSVDGKKSWKQWLPRYAGMWQHLRISAGEKIGILGKLIWAGSLIIDAHKPVTNQDSWLLSHMMVLRYTEKRTMKCIDSVICDLAIKYWKFKKPLESWKIMSAYLGPDCQDHPLIEAWRPYN